MTVIIASTEIVSGLFLAIILLNLLRTKADDHSWKRNHFVAFALSTAIGLFSDALVYILDGYISVGQTFNRLFLLIANGIAYSMINFCIVFFAFYMFALIKVKSSVSQGPPIFILTLAVLDILFIIIGIINKKAFTVEDNVLVYGPWKDFVLLTPIASIVFIMFMLLFNLRNLEKRYAVALSSFIVFPLIAAVIVILIPGCELAYTAAALSCAVVYLYIQHEEVTEAKLREQIMDNISRMDSLTGLMNRRGYDEALNKASDCTCVGIVFCDLNALKYTNDNYGHAAGDAYIKKFADILRDVFKDFGDICRISGDEFVVLLYDIATEKLDVLKERLNTAITENSRMASVGYAYGEKEPMIELVSRAEKDMYDDKNRYYAETGIDRRRR